MGYETILVLSGGTKEEDLANYAYQPDRVVASVADLINEVKSSGEWKVGSGQLLLDGVG
jgi:NagD protein